MFEAVQARSLHRASANMALLLLLLLFSNAYAGSGVRVGDAAQHDVDGFHRVDRRQLENSTDTPQESKELRIEENEKELLLPSCNDILLHETIKERCHHAKNCEGEYLMTTLLPLKFCNDPSTSSPLDDHPLLLKFFPVLFPISLFLLTLLLFRLLGSTAENYFSPALEMISSNFQIPPQLAGVTLLALGNGAPDVSAVVNAIKMNASEGIPLSLGELTGGGMFVQSVVVGRIVFLGSSLAAGKQQLGKGKVLGVTCREELIRDIAMYAISAAYVYWMCAGGVIFYRHVVGMLLLYCGYVAVVVVFELRRYCSKLSNMEGYTVGTNNLGGDAVKPAAADEVSLIHATTQSFDEEDQEVELATRSRHIAAVDPPALSPRKNIDPPGIAQSTRVLRLIKKQQERQRKKIMEKKKSVVIEPHHPQDRLSAQLGMSLEDRPWSLQLFSDSLRELCQHFYGSLYSDVWANSELSKFEWFCMSLESPFIILRKLVTPIPCEEEYNRSLVAYSIVLSPLWISFYLTTKIEDFDPFGTNGADGGQCFPSAFWPCSVSFAIGCAVIKYAPKEEASALPLHYSLPIALYGFLIAASWIDVISDQLVNVLEFIGVVLRIPAPIMGMTVLAWGNSVGDYTTNGALAQRGLADMSMTACFAGPSFNLLVGLGCGLLTQKESLLSNDGLQISLMPSVQTGFVFLICNCAITIFSGVWNKGIIPKIHGYIFWAMYFTYMAMSVQHLVM